MSATNSICGICSLLRLAFRMHFYRPTEGLAHLLFQATGDPRV